ncbi:MAG: GNAT family N-acetyltransferase [Chloroflexota bacterium]|nr:GNAT family N-acetyltransferase [Chloroflexota bacterium]
MFALTLEQSADLRDWFLPDRAGPLVGLHVLNSGHGTFYVDRWPGPRAVLVESGRNYALLGEPDVLAPGDLLARIVIGSVDASEHFEPLLRAAFPAMTHWARVILELLTTPVRVGPRTGVIVRRLGPGDASDVAGLDPQLAWISSTWGGPIGLSASGYAWGAFATGRLVAAACSFFVGDHYEDIGVVTQPTHRRLGLSMACAAGLFDDIKTRGRLPSWTTATDNHMSLRVAEKLGFVVQRRNRLLIVGGPVPDSAQ